MLLAILNNLRDRPMGESILVYIDLHVIVKCYIIHAYLTGLLEVLMGGE